MGFRGMSMADRKRDESEHARAAAREWNAVVRAWWQNRVREIDELNRQRELLRSGRERLGE